MYFSFLKSPDTEFLYLPSFACVFVQVNSLKKRASWVQPKVLPTFIEAVWAVVVKKFLLDSCLSKVVPNPVTLPAFESFVDLGYIWSWVNFWCCVLQLIPLAVPLLIMYSSLSIFCFHSYLHCCVWQQFDRISS